MSGRYIRYSESFSAPGTGVVKDLTARPVQSFSMQVVGVGGVPTSWDVRLESALDGASFTQLLQHTSLSSALGVIVGSGAQLFPSSFMRIRVAGLVLGLANGITVYVVGLQ
jgi:hypothetical protein